MSIPDRKAIQIMSASKGNYGHMLHALCDDGSVWVYRPDAMPPYWYKLQDIPQEVQNVEDLQSTG